MAGLAYVVLCMCIAAFAVWLGCHGAKRIGSGIAGWAIGLATFAILVVATIPISDAFERAACRGAKQYQECVDGESGISDWF